MYLLRTNNAPQELPIQPTSILEEQTRVALTGSCIDALLGGGLGY